ncbi:hypothetical protein HJC99_06475 [Candidatus Saccharibacteria bacterium]|nr:hypothetical protein [Candidatus Saccharibacteria bacterium]
MYAKRLRRATEALGFRLPKNFRSKLVKLTITTVSIASMGMNIGVANAANYTNASVALSDPRPSVASNYTFTASSVTASLTKCVKITASTTNGGTTAPTGFDMTSYTVNAGSTLINSNLTGWSGVLAGSGSNKNILSYTNSTGITPSTTTGATFVLQNVTNSSVVDTSYFYTVATFGSIDCATTPIDATVIKFINTNGSTLTLSVDPTLTFTVNSVASGQLCNGATSTVASTATTIPFGPVTTATDQVVCQDLTAATNATNGYTVYTRYTAKPTNLLGQTIADWTGTNTAPTAFPAAGTEAYGYTTSATSLGTGTAGRFVGGNWAAETTTNAEVGYSATGVTNTTYRIGHQVGVSLTTKPGSYTTNIIYTCTPIY